ncbi:MAG: Gamma-glutamyltranspeptidase @ Glutathione hydrolase [uncultured Thermomicrobiales bacterium]|uniref:Glutathione hydrolase proenzyme n=1 Tax=uncultured Thermomicrobiales bacterium TaxID=1645740 RepID=A0A6J4TZK5_9BACT|nr:MAG: Gamma-glutamyltranspeptidase @ Glutathione hydrolase [uncultured Thermomicrobiales bacterium]
MSTRTDWILDRHEARAPGGMVATKDRIAAELGAEVLRRGGNAVDAAVTAAFALGVVEPFMSGVGGGGFLVAHLPERGETVVVDYAMVAPRAASAGMYPLAGGSDQDLFGWPAVEGNANTVGHRAVAVPGTVAGLALALERFGTVPLAEALAPAIRLADEGFPVSWHTALYVAIDLENLNRYPATRATFTDDGVPPSPLPGLMRPLRQPDLAATLRSIAAEGPRVFYEGPIADAIVADMRANDGLIDAGDLASYRARVVPPLRSGYRGHEVVGAPAASGGPTVLETLNLMEGAPLARLGHNSVAALHEIAEACRQALVDRFAYLADPDFVPVPVAELVSKAYAAEQRTGFLPDRARETVLAGDRGRLGVAHDPETSEPGYGRLPMTTTHVSVVDRAGNAVSLTQTLLSGWGSRVVVPGTGVLLNNGMMWFDPEPGRPNSIEGGKRPLANMAPILLLRDGQSFMSLGAMGGRRILNAVPQIVANVVDFGMGIQEAITAPRIDYSTRRLEVSDRLPAETIAGLESLGYPVHPVEEHVLSFEFGSPVGVLALPDGLAGGANPFYPAMAVGVD